MRRSFSWSLALGGVTVLITACSLFETTTAPSSNVGGDALPVQQPGEDYDIDPAPLSGTVILAPNGCWYADVGDGPRILMFPAGYTQDAVDGSIMCSPDGTAITDGVVFDGAGEMVRTANIPGGPDGYWGNYLSFCQPELDGVVILDSLNAVGGGN